MNRAASSPCFCPAAPHQECFGLPPVWNGKGKGKGKGQWGFQSFPQEWASSSGQSPAFFFGQQQQPQWVQTQHFPQQLPQWRQTQHFPPPQSQAQTTLAHSGFKPQKKEPCEFGNFKKPVIYENMQVVCCFAGNCDGKHPPDHHLRRKAHTDGKTIRILENHLNKTHKGEHLTFDKALMISLVDLQDTPITVDMVCDSIMKITTDHLDHPCQNFRILKACKFLKSKKIVFEKQEVKSFFDNFKKAKKEKEEEEEIVEEDAEEEDEDADEVTPEYNDDVDEELLPVKSSKKSHLVDAKTMQLEAETRRLNAEAENLKAQNDLIKAKKNYEKLQKKFQKDNAHQAASSSQTPFNPDDRTENECSESSK